MFVFRRPKYFDVDTEDDEETEVPVRKLTIPGKPLGAVQKAGTKTNLKKQLSSALPQPPVPPVFVNIPMSPTALPSTLSIVAADHSSFASTQSVCTIPLPSENQTSCMPPVGNASKCKHNRMTNTETCSVAFLRHDRPHLLLAPRTILPCSVNHCSNSTVSPSCENQTSAFVNVEGDQESQEEEISNAVTNSVTVHANPIQDCITPPINLRTPVTCSPVDDSFTPVRNRTPVMATTLEHDTPCHGHDSQHCNNSAGIMARGVSRNYTVQQSTKEDGKLLSTLRHYCY
jgi:hypothetical protein